MPAGTKPARPSCQADILKTAKKNFLLQTCQGRAPPYLCVSPDVQSLVEAAVCKVYQLNRHNILDTIAGLQRRGVTVAVLYKEDWRGSRDCWLAGSPAPAGRVGNYLR